MIVMSTKVVWRSPVTDVCFEGTTLYGSSSRAVYDPNEDGNIIGYTGSLTRLGDSPAVLHSSKKQGFTAVTRLAGGDFALGTTMRYGVAQILIVSAKGKVKRRLEASLPGDVDWLAAGGAPERLFAATIDQPAVEEWTTDSWQRHVLQFGDRSSAPTISSAGLSRIRTDGDSRVVEYAWGGRPRVKTPALVPALAAQECVRFEDGWFIFSRSARYGSKAHPSMFVDLSGETRWTTGSLGLYAACCGGGRTVLGVTQRSLLLVDVFNGKTLASIKRKTVLDTSGTIVRSNGAGTFAVGTGDSAGTEGGVELVQVEPFQLVPVVSAEPSPRRRPRALARPVVSAEDVTVATFEKLVDRVCATQNPRALENLHGKLSDLELLEASDAPSRGKRVEKGVRRLRAHLKAVTDPEASSELQHILDTVTDS